MVITLNEEAAVRATELARSRGVSTDEVVTELVLAAPAPGEDRDAGLEALEAFFGCGTGKASVPQLSVKEMRRELAARKLADGIENI